MARGKSKGFRYIGKEVQTSEFRIDKDLFLNRTKATSDTKIHNALVVSSGKVITAQAAHNAGAVLDDDNAAIAKTSFGSGNILSITVTANRTKALPSTANLLEALGLTVFYQFVDIPFINLGATHRLTLNAADGDTTFLGSNFIAAGYSGLFRFIAMGGVTPDEVKIIRLA